MTYDEIMDEHQAIMEDLRNEDRAARRRHRALMRNPDCRDPEHPGCENCWDEDED